MKLSWMEFCHKLNENTAPCGRRPGNESAQYIDLLYHSYNNYDLGAISNLFKGYLIAANKLHSHIEDPAFQHAVKYIMDLYRALFEHREPSIQYVNEFVHKSHTVVKNTLNRCKI